MSNLFLLNEAIEVQNFNDFKEGMSELVAIVKTKEDIFSKHESVYYLNNYESLCNSYGQAEGSILQFIEQLKPNQNYYHNQDELDASYPDTINAFLGINFAPTSISKNRQIINKTTYNNFKHEVLWTFDFRGLWAKREQLFPNIILCGAVEQQLAKIGNSDYFNQIVDRLKVFDTAVAQWGTGNFSYKYINNNYPLRISPESEQTMSKYGNERIYSLPKGSREYFELHIKTGDLRFHFFPNDRSHEVYIGYIGPHLNTVNT